VLKIQSIQASLEHVDETKVPEIEEIHGCLETAHNSLRVALAECPSGKPVPNQG
jgi:hypothetical protein